MNTQSVLKRLAELLYERGEEICSRRDSNLVWLHLRFAIRLLAICAVAAMPACSMVENLTHAVALEPTRQYRQEAYSIYKLVLTEIYPQEPIYVIDQVTYPNMTITTPQPTLFPYLSPETLADSKASIDQSQSLAEIFLGEDEQFVLVDSSQYYMDSKKESSLQCSWTQTRCFNRESFQSKFPQADGIYRLSNIGFNPDHTQALVSTEIHNEATSGTNYQVLLTRHNGRWTIQDILETFWIA
jgi:hypothetical protein